jgi:hypothetical protein
VCAKARIKERSNLKWEIFHSILADKKRKEKAHCINNEYMNE